MQGRRRLNPEERKRGYCLIRYRSDITFISTQEGLMTTTHSKSTERPASTANGLLMLLLGLLLIVGGPVAVAQDPDSALLVVGGIVTAVIGLLLVCGLYSLQPNE